MQPALEPPFFLLSMDNSRLSIHRSADGATEHLNEHYVDDDKLMSSLICFDGLARPLEVRTSKNKCNLVLPYLSYLTCDTWQVRARVLQTVKNAQALLATKDKPIIIYNKELKDLDRAEVEELDERLRQLESSIGFDKNFAEFATACVQTFDLNATDFSAELANSSRARGGLGSALKCLLCGCCVVQPLDESDG
jgi:hypothetical protein